VRGLVVSSPPAELWVAGSNPTRLLGGRLKMQYVNMCLTDAVLAENEINVRVKSSETSSRFLP
jgi:hypothetical protein